MAKLIALKIDVTKITRERLYKGAKGTYLDLIVEVRDDTDKYDNNVNSWEGQTKEERTNKADRNFLGSGKVIWEDDKPQKAKPESKEPEPIGDDDSLPWD